jgi:SOS response regulatory protein OraA/RecX
MSQLQLTVQEKVSAESPREKGTLIKGAQVLEAYSKGKESCLRSLSKRIHSFKNIKRSYY